MKNNVIKKTVYDKLIAKVNNIDTKGLALKTKYESELESKTPDTSRLVKKTDYSEKISETENKITNITSLVKKTDYKTKISEFEKDLLIIIMRNVLLLQNLTNLQKNAQNFGMVLKMRLKQ